MALTDEFGNVPPPYVGLRAGRFPSQALPENSGYHAVLDWIRQG